MLSRWFTNVAVLAALFLWSFSAFAQEARKEVADRDITSAVETELWVDDAVDANRIDVETKEGIVTLSGTVGNFEGARPHDRREHRGRSRHRQPDPGEAGLEPR